MLQGDGHYEFVMGIKTWIPSNAEGTDAESLVDDGPKPFRNRKGQFKLDNPGRPPGDPEKRWNEHYKVLRKTECYQWKGALNASKRGRFFDGKVMQDAQQYAWFREYGEYPQGRIKTTCDTPCCVNPAHLYELIQKKPRPQAVFTRQDVLDIRRRVDAGEKVIRIAKDYPNASEQSVFLVARRKTYLWVGEENASEDPA